MQIRSIRYLEQRFDVIGTGYKNYTKGRIHSCRHLTEIRRKGNKEEKCEALLILSSPKQLRGSEHDYLFEVNPMTTQELPLRELKINADISPILYLMERMQWNMMKVIYLTDIIYYNEARFSHDLLFMRKNDIQMHSIFSDSRKHELNSLFSNGSTIVAAWGAKVELQPLAEKAIKELKKIGNIYGIIHHSHPFLYQSFIKGGHLNEQWTVELEEQLKSSEKNNENI